MLRKNLGLNQKDFAASLGIRANTYNNYENGNRAPNTDFFELISKKYNVSVDYLIGLTEDSTKYYNNEENPITLAGDGAESDALNDEIMRVFGALPEDKRRMALDLISHILEVFLKV